MFKKIVSVLLGISICALTASCGEKPAENEPLVVSESVEETEDKAEEVQEVSEEDKDETMKKDREIIVYFPNWKIDDENGKLESIPWDKVTIVNHAFWKIEPNDGTSESSFERRSQGLEARTNFKIVSTQPANDEIFFEQYAKLHEEHPEVTIMISIGGWNASGYFSEMAYTEEGVKSFTDSCVELMDTYPWIGGIDIDWEHPGGSNDGERLPESDVDEGCPVWGTNLEERYNFPGLLQYMRDTFDSHFSEKKLLTACASASTGWTLPNMEWGKAAEPLDYVNIMTYDLAGLWDHRTGHASSVAGAKNAMAYMFNKKIPSEKINIGAAFYGTGFVMTEDAPLLYPVGADLSPEKPIGNEVLTRPFIKSLLADASDDKKGWHTRFDEKPGASYLYNDDENSEYFMHFISYEDENSIAGKAALIEKYNLGGIIVLEVTQDTTDHELISCIYDNLH